MQKAFQRNTLIKAKIKATKQNNCLCKRNVTPNR